jgi:hypothetical protein
VLRKSDNDFSQQFEVRTMKVIAGIIGGLLFSWSAALIASLVAAWLLPTVNGVAWITFLATFTTAFVFALSARSAKIAWCYLLSSAGALWIASAATFFAMTGKSASKRQAC